MKKNLTKAQKAKLEREAEKKKLKKERAEAMRELEQDIKAKKRRIKKARKSAQKEVPDNRTPEQVEFSAKAIEELHDFLKDKYVFSKSGAKVYPRLMWSFKPIDGEGVIVPFEKGVFVKETEHIKEVYKPNKTYKNYLTERDPVPELVIMNGFKDILGHYGISHLDDYTVRKLFYHIILSLAHYLDVNPEFYLKLSDIDIYREPLVRNMFTVVIPEYSYKEKKKTIDSLYDYFVGGEMDFEALQKTLDVYALSYIEYTEDRRSLRDKAKDSFVRYRKMQEILEEAKTRLKQQGISGPGYRKAAEEMRKQIAKERAEKWKKTYNPSLLPTGLTKEDYEQKDLTNEKDCGIIDTESDNKEEK